MPKYNYLYNYLGQPVPAAVLEKMQDEHGLFHVEFPMTIEQYNAYLKQYGGSWNTFIEDMLVQGDTMCSMSIKSSRMHDLCNGKLIMRVDGHVEPESYFQGTLRGTITITLNRDIADYAKDKDDLALKSISKVREDIQKVFGDDAKITEDGFTVVWK